MIITTSVMPLWSRRDLLFIQIENCEDAKYGSVERNPSAYSNFQRPYTTKVEECDTLAYLLALIAFAASAFNLSNILCSALIVLCS